MFPHVPEDNDAPQLPNPYPTFVTLPNGPKLVFHGTLNKVTSTSETNAVPGPQILCWVVEKVTLSECVVV